MVSSVFAPSRRRRTELWRNFQRSLRRELALVATLREPAGSPQPLPSQPAAADREADRPRLSFRERHA